MTRVSASSIVSLSFTFPDNNSLSQTTLCVKPKKADYVSSMMKMKKNKHTLTLAHGEGVMNWCCMWGRHDHEENETLPKE
jgi:hypothetical protein